MDKKKLVQIAREKAREKMSATGDVEKSAREVGSGGKVSGRKPQQQSQPSGRVSALGRTAAEQLHGKN